MVGKRKRASFSDTHPSASSWLDIYPLPVLSPSPPSKRRCKISTLQTEKLKSRVHALTPKLDAIKASVAARQHIKHLFLTGGRFCLTCSPSHLPPGSCASSCPLLRPRHTAGAMLVAPPSYILENNDLAAGLDTLLNSMEMYGHGAGLPRVRDWERKVRMLFEETGPVRVPRMPGRVVEGLDWRWTFQGHWGRGVGVEEGVAPEEVR